ncbi:MAG: efflux RND transporter permease subunit [Treponema sp.]|nr:efflux RND transporter permease subunit [Treponema sp.]
MSISELSVRKPVTITMSYILACVIAFVFLPRLGIALYPSVTRPVLSVFTSYPNVGPEEIDKNVTEYLVNRLTRVPSLKKITSNSSTGSSRITLQFGYDVDIDKAMDNVQNILNQSQRALPADCSTPVVRKFDMSGRAFMRMAIQGNLQKHELKEIAENIVQPLLERIEGVASTDVSGGAAKQIAVDVSTNRLQAHNLTISNISQALSARNIQLSGGSVTQNDVKYEIVTNSYYTSLDEIRDTVLKTHNDGSVLRLSDVANVYEDFSKDGSKIYINGLTGLYISVTNESDANVSTIAKKIHAAMPTINAELPEGIRLEILSDDTTMIDSTMKQVYGSAVEGVILAMLIIFIFLRSIKSSLIIGLSIPISILITLMVMAIMDLTVNMMTMSGLILALGMTVDSSIVILENIQKYRLRGEKSAVAAILGSRNMMTAIAASTLTTLCVFVPMLIFKAELENFGQMFEDLIITVCVAMIVSLIVAVTLVPALCGSILRLDTRTQKPLKNKILKKIDTVMENAIIASQNFYVRLLSWSLRNRFICMTLVFLLVVFSVTQFIGIGMSLSPQSSSDDQVYISLQMPIGTDNDIVLSRLFEFQEIILNEINRDDYKNIILNSGSGNSGSIQINLPPLEKQKINPAQIREKLSVHLKRWPDANVTFSAGRGMGGSSGIDVKIISDNNIASTETANAIVAVLKEKVPQLQDVSTDLENGAPKFDLIINQDMAGFYGVSVSTIASTLRTAITGSTPTVFFDGGDEFNIVVSVNKEELASTSDILALTVPTKSGNMTLDSFVTLREGRSPQRIQRENKERINHVTAKIVSGYTATDVQKLVEQTISDNIIAHPDVTISYGGEAADISKFGSVLAFVIVLAVFLVFAVMAAQFESLVDPFIIFITIPLCLIGIIVTHNMTGLQFSTFSIVGIVALIGIVVNNGIILVDYTNQLVAKKMKVFEAAIEAGRSRFQPILMTTLTTILGMVPMAFFPGKGAEQMQPIALTIVGGLTSGSIFTLFVAPIMYTVFNKRREKHYDDPESLHNQLTSESLKLQ